ncbi:MAG: hypothetical protein R3C45_16310 [Phycisphaerales bacterium]
MGHYTTEESTFKLIVRNRPIAGEPQPEDFKWRLQMQTDETDTFVLLKSPGHFMQCSGTADGGFRVEYREGTAKEHFASTDKALPLDATADLFASYLNRDERWRRAIRWEQAGNKPSKGRSFKLIDRRGDTLVINKKWCLILIGAVFNAIGAGVFFLLNGLMDLYLTWIPGSLISIGVIFLGLSTFCDD